MSHSVRIQPEYFAPKQLSPEGSLEDEKVQAVGILDGLGKKHVISPDNLVRLVHMCTALPVRTPSMSTSKLARK